MGPQDNFMREVAGITLEHFGPASRSEASGRTPSLCSDSTGLPMLQE
jgi:hypothetical protein